jgi:hypothetical protein
MIEIGPNLMNVLGGACMVLMMFIGLYVVYKIIK